MSNVITVWVQDGSSENFERHVPLLWGAVRNRKLGSANNICLLFIEGLRSLDNTYRENLTAQGYSLVDGSASYRAYADTFYQLNRFSDFEKKCFLRWLVVKDIFGSSPVIHYDGDIVFNATPEQLEDEFGAETFVLQGCPAFVSTAKSSWLQDYEKALRQFSADIDGYSAQAWIERNGWESSKHEKWSGTRFRKIISSDQDLISHLIHTNRLPQNRPADIKAKSDLVLFENPLDFFIYTPELVPLNYQRAGGVDFFSGKQVAFWHMQSDFVRYLAVNSGRGFMNQICRCPNLIENSGIEQFFWRVWLRITSNRLDRRCIYRKYFESEDFSGVFNDNNFWKHAVFCE